MARAHAAAQVAEASEVLTVLHKLPGLQRLLGSLHTCNYGDFFPGFLQTLAFVETDFLLAPHARHIMRELRVVAYRQYLASYKSVTLAAMASAFGVSPDFLDAEARTRSLPRRPPSGPPVAPRWCFSCQSTLRLSSASLQTTFRCLDALYLPHSWHAKQRRSSVLLGGGAFRRSLAFRPSRAHRWQPGSHASCWE